MKVQNLTHHLNWSFFLLGGVTLIKMTRTLQLTPTSYVARGLAVPFAEATTKTH